MAKNPEKDSLGETLEKLALKLARDASGKDVKVAERIDAMKVLTPYYTATRKLKLKAPDEDEEVATFGSFKDKIRTAA